MGAMIGAKREKKTRRGRVVQITVAGSQRGRRVNVGGKEVAQLRSSVIHIDSQNDSPIRPREKEGEKKKSRLLDGRGEQGTVYHHARRDVGTLFANAKGTY